MSIVESYMIFLRCDTSVMPKDAENGSSFPCAMEPLSVDTLESPMCKVLLETDRYIVDIIVSKVVKNPSDPQIANSYLQHRTYIVFFCQEHKLLNNLDPVLEQ